MDASGADETAGETVDETIDETVDETIDETVDETGANATLPALERFVVDNDDLLALEERIGRFNIFDSLGIARTEIRHSQFLAWLLDPGESHGQGALFLNAVLMDLLRQAPPELRPLSPVELDGEELRGVEVRREWRRIDLLITCDEPPFVIAIENKVYSSEHSDQLARYQKVVAEQFAGRSAMYVYLTIDGDEPSADDWVPYTYADMHRVLARVRKTNAASVGDDVLAFLDHYLRLIGSRFMEDPKIDELCQRIYRNHRQAIDLIFERVGSPQRVMLERIEQFLLSQPERWHVFSKTSKAADFLPVSWVKAMPSLPSAPEANTPDWLRWWFYCRPKKGCRLLIELGPVGDPELTMQLVKRLTGKPDEFGFRGKAKVRPGGWTRLFSRAVMNWSEGNEPDESKLLEEVARTLDRVEKRLADVPDALRPVIEQWRSTPDQSV